MRSDNTSKESSCVTIAGTASAASQHTLEDHLNLGTPTREEYNELESLSTAITLEGREQQFQCQDVISTNSTTRSLAKKPLTQLQHHLHNLPLPSPHIFCRAWVNVVGIHQHLPFIPTPTLSQHLLTRLTNKTSVRLTSSKQNEQPWRPAQFSKLFSTRSSS